MCGISGCLRVKADVPAEALTSYAEAMACAQPHRGPDDSGVWTDAAAGIALSHRRLSIIDLSERGHQPMTSASGRYVVSYNGEAYNFRELRRVLVASGHRFRSSSDTEVLLAAFEAWGVTEGTKRVHGMFAFAVWDRQERTLHLGRDRVGEKPLYYGWQGDWLLFGSELSALKAHPAWMAEIDRDALAAYFRLSSIPAPLTIFQSTYKVVPGTIVTIGTRTPRGEPATTTYWSALEVARAGLANPLSIERSEAAAALEALLKASIQRQMVADVPLGAFLSGGVDSSTVVALMQEQSPRPIKTFTIGFHEREFNEATYAARVASHLGTEHTELYVTAEEAMGVIPSLPRIYDEPFADPSQIPTYLVSALARRHVTVALSGDGGDELFGGYNRYFAGPRIWNVIRRVPASLRTRLAPLVQRTGPAVGAVTDRLARVLPRSVVQVRPGEKMKKVAALMSAGSSSAMYSALTSVWPDPESLVLASREPYMPAYADDLNASASLAELMMYLDLIIYLPTDILTKVDRAAMAVSLETRIPLLDPTVVEFAWQLPPALRVSKKSGKLLLRDVLHKRVPQALIERPKMGFSIPVGRWIKGRLRGWAEELLDQSRLRREGFLEPGLVRALWADHLAGRVDGQFPLWSVLMFQAWLDCEKVTSQSFREASPEARTP